MSICVCCVLWVCVYYEYMCLSCVLCTTCVPGTHRRQERVRASESGVQVVVSHQIAPGNWTLFSERAAISLLCWALSPTHFGLIKEFIGPIEWLTGLKHSLNKTDNMNSILRSYRGRRERTLKRCSLISTNVPWHTLPPMHDIITGPVRQLNEALAVQAWQPELSPQKPHRWRSNSMNCFLTSTCACGMCTTHTHRKYRIKIFSRDFALGCNYGLLEAILDWPYLGALPRLSCSTNPRWEPYS